MKYPQEPAGRKARGKDKLSELINFGGKGCVPRNAVLSKDVGNFVNRVPIGGNTPVGKRDNKWQKLGIDYIHGLLLPGKRKSMGPMASRIPETDYQQVQQFITDSPWDHRATLDSLISYMKNEMSSPDGVVIIDDTGVRKQGKDSPGVGDQYFVETKSVARCQNSVTMVYAQTIGPTNADTIIWPLGMELYLPKAWEDDKPRRKRAGIPDEIEYEQKWKLALKLIENTMHLGVPHKVVLADTWYGNINKFREQLREWNEPYIVGIRLSEVLTVPVDTPFLLLDAQGKGRGPRWKYPRMPQGTEIKKASDILAETIDWKTISWGKGTKGILEAKFAMKMVRIVTWAAKEKGVVKIDEVVILLLEDGPEGLKGYLCWGLDDCSIEELVSLTHTRWPIEQYHKDIKNELGFGHFEGRKWRGWYHHAVLVQMAYAILALVRYKSRRSGDESPLPSLPEIHRKVVSAILKFLCEDRKEISFEFIVNLVLSAV